MTNPLVHYDFRNIGHVEPSINGIIELEKSEPTRSDPINDLVIISPFRSGKPLTLVRHGSLATIEALHDPDGNGDQGVALARVAKRPFSDSDVFGAARIITCRVDPSENAFCFLTDGASANLIKIERTDYGSHTNGPGVTFGAGTHGGKKVVLADTVSSPFIGDDLGILLTGLQYVGAGSAAALSIVVAVGKIAYSGQPADADKLTINGKVFEFDSNAAVTGGNVAVTIGANMDATFAALATAITANCPGVTASADATNNVVTLTALEQGVVMSETLDTGNVTSLTHLPPAARLRVAVTGASDSLDIPLTVSQFSSIDRLASFINNQEGFTCSVSPYANKFLLSSGLDVAGMSNVNVKTAPIFLTGYVAATVDFINTKTRGRYIATEVARSEPVDQTVVFAGGATRPVTVSDWQNALDAVGAALELGGILLLDTDDPAIFAMTATFIREQENNGKWFRGFFGAQPARVSGQDISAYDAIAAALDSTRCRLVVQRVGLFRADSRSIDYMHPVYFAAALAGGAAGNRPYVRPLTNKRMPFAGLHPDDSFTQEVREALLLSGITVAKQEADRLVVALAVTTSRDPDRRMARIASEVDTVDLINATVTDRFRQFRGQWANLEVVGRVKGVLQATLQEFVTAGALVAGRSAAGVPIPAWSWPDDPPYTVTAGGIELKYQIYIGSEINHVDAYGRAAYQRIVGDVSGGSVLDQKVAINN